MTQETGLGAVESKVAARLARRGMWRAVVLSGIIFVGGAASGFGVAVLVGPKPPRPGGQAGTQPGPGNLGAPDPPVPQLVARLREELLLTKEQEQKVEKIYQERFDALRSVRDEMKPKMTAEYNLLKEQIKAVLTPEQFDRWNQRFENVRNRMLPPPPRREGDGPGQGYGPGDGPRNGERGPRGEGPRGEGPRGGPPPREGPGAGGPGRPGLPRDGAGPEGPPQ